jgi:murein DD-endopeptidase MepM/ murein hydrolase activator NlpD
MRLPAVLLPAALLASALLVPTAAPAAGPVPDEYSPVLQTTLGDPWPVTGSDGRSHVVYEVQLVNASSLSWNVTRVSIVDGANNRSVKARWSGSRVKDVLVDIATKQPLTRIEPGRAALLYLTFSAAKRSDIPATLSQELRLTNAKPAGGGPPQATTVSDPTRLVRSTPSNLGPPLQGARWLAADGCCSAPRHVRSSLPFGGNLFTVQRFAIDWERLDENNRLFVGDDKVLTNWAGYGQNILAVADATVVRSIDGLPNQIPGKLPSDITPATADGNAVFLRLRDGRFVFYAHMIPGSVTVKKGDRVRRGQILGKVGNSGNSSAPHLHLHMMDRDAILSAVGFPYTFNAFTVTGKVASTDAFNEAELNGTPAKLGPVTKGPRRNELPLDQVIVSWP